MSKSRSHRSELDFLREEVRRLKSDNNTLRKQVSRASKRMSRLEDLEEMVKDEGMAPIEYKPINRCPECSGSLLQTQLVDVRIIIKCSQCSYRKTEKVKKRGQRIQNKRLHSKQVKTSKL